MKLLRIFFVLVILFSCNRQEKLSDRHVTNTIDSTSQQKEKSSFFPVTNYIKGQIFEIRNSAINPMKIVTIGQRSDSSWVKMETLEKEFKDFLSPMIDSAALISFYTERKFFDQTMDAITLTYDPVGNLPANFLFQRWDVYIDPTTNSVKRIYLVKKLPGKKFQQLTWSSGKRCTIVTIATDDKGNSSVEKSITIKWVF